MADDTYTDDEVGRERMPVPDLGDGPREATADFWTKPRALKGSAQKLTGEKIAADPDEMRGAARVFRQQAGWLRDAETKMREEVELAAGVFMEAFAVEEVTETLRDTCAKNLKLLADLCEDLDSSLIEVAELWEENETRQERRNAMTDFTMTQPDADLSGYEDPSGVFGGKKPGPDDLPEQPTNYTPGNASTLSDA